MKIAVTTYEGGLDDEVFPDLENSPTFTLVDSETMDAGVSQNPGKERGGLVAAEEIIKIGADAVITGRCNPNAMAVLEQANITVYSGSGNVKDAVNMLKAGKLVELQSGTIGFGRRGLGSESDLV